MAINHLLLSLSVSIQFGSYNYLIAFYSYCICYYISLCLQSAVGYDYQADLSKHESQTDSSKGFGGKYGVQKDSRDKVSYLTCT